MITSNGKFIVDTSSPTFYDTADVRIFITTQDETGDDILIEIRLYKNTQPNVVGSYNWRTTAALINAETGSGTGEWANFFTAAQLAVKTYLSGLNGAITFTIV